MSLLAFHQAGLHTPGFDEPLLEHLDFHLHAGESLILSGPPGCGTSSLLDLAAGVLRPTSGQVQAATAPGWLPQHGALVSNLTLWDNVALPLRWHLAADEATVTRTITDLCDVLECEMPGRVAAATATPEHRAVAAIARALVLAPQVLLADRPGEDLGGAAREDLWRMLWRVQAAWGTAILASTGDPGPASALTDRVLTLPARRAVAFRLWRGML